MMGVVMHIVWYRGRRNTRDPVTAERKHSELYIVIKLLCQFELNNIIFSTSAEATVAKSLLQYKPQNIFAHKPSTALL